MYIVTRWRDYETPDFLSAHEGREEAIKAAEALVAGRMDAWDIATARGDVEHAGDLGPALRAVAWWRVYDLDDYLVYEVVTAQSTASALG